MDGLTIRCYGDKDECQCCIDGWCGLYDRMCREIHVDMIMEDGEG